MRIRYSAKLLFQFRVCQKRNDCKKRYCEERIITFLAKNQENALGFAKKYGIKNQFDYKNSFGKTVKFEFVGVVDLIDLVVQEDKFQVWYDFKNKEFPIKKNRFLI